MGVKQWLIDKSAMVRLESSPDASEWTSRIQRGLVRLTAITRLEIGYSARSGKDLRDGFRRSPLASMIIEYSDSAIEDRAFEVLGLLADRGYHRAPSIPDLILAATAEINRLTILHVDKDFELVAQVTGQATERLRIPV